MFNGLNDVTVNPFGQIYITNTPYAWVLKWTDALPYPPAAAYCFDAAIGATNSG